MSKGVLNAQATVFGATDAMFDWATKNMRVLNPEYVSRMRMNKWVGNTPQYLNLYFKRGNDLIIPYGAFSDFNLAFPEVPWDTDPVWWDLPSRVNHHMTKKDFVLRDYQQDAVDAMSKAMGGILVAPAGCGKTQIGMALMGKLGLKTLWITHTLDLVKQAVARANVYFGEDHVGTIIKGQVNIGDYLTVATVQTMKSINLKEYTNEWDCIIVDECHRVSGSPTANTMFRAVLSQLSAQHKYGLTATLHRADGMVKATESILGHVVHEVPTNAVGDYICKVGIVTLPLATEPSWDYCNTDGTLCHAKLLNYLCEDPDRNEMIMKFLVANRNRPSLILSDRLNQLESLMYLLPQDMRGDACIIKGTSNAEVREEYLAQMRTGKKKYLFATYALAKEGLDIPRLSAVYFASPVKDKAVVTQAVGRVQRICENKADPIVLDFVDYKINYCQRIYKSRQKVYNTLKCYYVDTSKH